MNANTTAWWRTGGARWEQGRAMPDETYRAMCMSLPRQGMVRGVHIVTGYQYIGHDRHKRIRRLLYDEIVRLSTRGPGTSQCVIGADWNAEVGTRGEGDPVGRWTPILGPHGNKRRGQTGEALLQVCEANDWVIAETFTPQRTEGTWFHPRFGS